MKMEDVSMKVTDAMDIIEDQVVVLDDKNQIPYAAYLHLLLISLYKHTE